MLPRWLAYTCFRALRQSCIMLLVGSLAAACAHRSGAPQLRGVTTDAQRQSCHILSPDGQHIWLHAPMERIDNLAKWCERLTPLTALPPVSLAYSPELPYAQQLQQALQNLDFFAAVACKSEAQGAVSCTLSPKTIVRSFSLKGHWPIALFADDLRRRVYLRPGTFITDIDATLQQQEARLRSYLQEEGYYDAAVSIVAHPARSRAPQRALHLDIHVLAKKYLQVRKVDVFGDVPVATEQLAAPFMHRGWFGYQGRFRPAGLLDDIEQANAALGRAGFVGGRIEVHRAAHPEANAIDLSLQVRAGRQYTLRTCGLGPVSRRKIAALAPFEKSGSIDAVSIAAYQQSIFELYQSYGYADAQVVVQSRYRGPQQVELIIDVTPGEKKSVRAMRVRGIGRKTLERLLGRVQLLQKTDGRVLHRAWQNTYVAHDAEALQAAMVKMGYTDARIEAVRLDPEPGAIELLYQVTRGPKHSVGRITWRDLPPGVPADALQEELKLQPGGPFSAQTVERDVQTLQTALFRQGYLHAQVEAQLHGAVTDAKAELKTPGKTQQTDIVYVINAGRQSRFGGMLISGNFRTRSSTLQQELHLSPGAPLDLLGVGSARRSLRGLNIFHNVALSPKTPYPAGNDDWLMLRLEERDVRTLDGLAAFSSDYRFAIGAELRDANVLGRAMQLNLQVRLANVSKVFPYARIGDQDIIEAQLRAPHPFGLPFLAEGQALYRHQSVKGYMEKRIGGMVAVSRPLLSSDDCTYCVNLSGRLAYEVFDTNRDDSGRATVARLVPSLDLDMRDSGLDPHSGYHIDLRLEGAHPQLAPGLRRATRFWRLLTGVQVFIPLGTPWQYNLQHGRILGGPWILALAGAYASAGPYGPGGRVPGSETYFYGGDLSVRGLRPKASGEQLENADYMVTGSAELRILLAQNLGIGHVQIAAFVDVGSVAAHPHSLFKQTTVSIGPALRYVTAIGPLSLAYGKTVYVPDALRASDFAPRRGRLHFTFGYTF